MLDVNQVVYTISAQLECWLDVECSTGSSGDDHSGQTGFLLFERDVEDLELLEKRVAGLGALILVGARGEWFALFAANPHPRLTRAVASHCFRSKVIRRAVTDVLIGAFARAGIQGIEESRHLVLQEIGRVRLELGVCQRFEGRNLGWKVRVPGGSTPVPLIVARLQEGNLEILDYLLLDCCPVRKESFRFSEGSVKSYPTGTAEEVVAELISRSRLHG